VLDVLNRALYYPIVVLLLGALVLRRRASERKRFALIAWGGLMVALRVCAWLFLRLGIAEALFVAPLAAAVVFVWALRGLFVPFRLRCSHCRERLPAAQVLTSDEAQCARCAAARKAEGGAQPSP